jgi:hypothetical protein
MSEMRQSSRDNFIYLAIGLGVAALVVTDVIYSDSHGLTMWWPSRFAFRGIYTTILLSYFVVRETRKVKATVLEILTCVVFASIIHLAITFAFHNAVGQLSGLSFVVLVAVEMFFVLQSLLQALRYLKSS